MLPHEVPGPARKLPSDVDRGTRTSVTFEGGNNWPIWSPDGGRLAFMRAGGIHWAPADGSGQPEELFATDQLQIPTSWSSDGRTMAYTESNPDGDTDLWVLALLCIISSDFLGSIFPGQRIMAAVRLLPS